MRKLKLSRAFVPLLATALTLAGCGGSSPPPRVQHAVTKGGLATTVQTSYGGRTHSQAFLQQVENPPASALPTLPTATPQLSGYDAVTASAVPFKAQVALCYANGHYANCTAVKARQPQHLVTIAVNTSGVARLLDVEPGDASPSQAGAWVKQMIQVHHIWRPGIYASSSNMFAVEQSLRGAGLQRSQYVLMAASWDGNPTVPSGFDAKQWRSTQALDYDSFLTSFFQSAPAPKRTICWGKNSTPTSSTCRKIEGQAHAEWANYLNTKKNLSHRNTELRNVERNISALQANNIHIAVKVNYVGPGAGWVQAQIKTLTARASQEKAAHDNTVHKYSG